MLTKQMKQILMYGFLMLSGISGCGDGEETKAPAVKLTASVVQSGVSSPASDNHTHSVTIPFSDPGSFSQANYVSSSVSGHSHTIALSSGQFADLRAGMQVKAVSTTVNGHSHTWTIYGGSFLYESICYNCHSDSKRGTRGMSSNSLTTAQRDALQNPSAAPLSLALAADPNVLPTIPGTLDGTTLYIQYCSGCHGTPLATTTITARTAAAISAAISVSASMTSVKGLSPTQIQAIASVLP